MYWILSSSIFRDFIDLTKGGSTIQHLYQNVFYRFLYGCPSIPEQKAIADYLDTKTVQIDHKIDLLTQKAVKYGELKQSLINETVTCGLNKTVKMKDSGVEWIGQVPEHWDVNFLVKALSSIVDYRGRTPKKVNVDENGMFLAVQYFTNWIRKSSIPITISNI